MKKILSLLFLITILPLNLFSCAGLPSKKSWNDNKSDDIALPDPKIINFFVKKFLSDEKVYNTSQKEQASALMYAQQRLLKIHQTQRFGVFCQPKQIYSHIHLSPLGKKYRDFVEELRKYFPEDTRNIAEKECHSLFLKWMGQQPLYCWHFTEKDVRALTHGLYLGYLFIYNGYVYRRVYTGKKVISYLETRFLNPQQYDSLNFR
ncbi:hypothetical protein K2W90_02450 [Candidatus Babeliales bacterium]|nr:hypothetical protein [Candidatus Babeliales bacterium]